jgi:hypothetical protein
MKLAVLMLAALMLAAAMLASETPAVGMLATNPRVRPAPDTRSRAAPRARA